MTLRQKQSLFMACMGKLIVYATSKGYELTAADFYRPDRKGHMEGSLHYERLAGDVNLFVGGEWMSTHCPEWDDLGEYWEALHPDCRWGGRLKSQDYNHFSVTHWGRA